MRIAFFGGTFDPIHRAHLRLAAAAADAFALDRVLFAPVGHQPLKRDSPTASFADRLAMTTLACNPDPFQPPPDSRFAVTGLDAPRPDNTPNYTVETLAALALEFPTADLFVLTGADSFLSLPRWRSPDRLLALAQWIVVSRPDFPLAPDLLDQPQFAALVQTPAARARIHLLTTVHEEVSATELRRRLHDGDPCSDLLPPAVAGYIQSHHLYR